MSSDLVGATIHAARDVGEQHRETPPQRSPLYDDRQWRILDTKQKQNQNKREEKPKQEQEQEEEQNQREGEEDDNDKLNSPSINTPRKNSNSNMDDMEEIIFADPM